VVLNCDADRTSLQLPCFAQLPMHAQVNRDGDSRRHCHQFYPLHLYNFSSTADGIV